MYLNHGVYSYGAILFLLESQVEMEENVRERIENISRLIAQDRPVPVKQLKTLDRVKWQIKAKIRENRKKEREVQP